MLLLPNLALLWWLFSAVSLHDYLAVIYAGDMPVLLRLPAAGVCLAVLLGILARRGSALAPGTTPSLTPQLALGAVAVFLLLAVLFDPGFLLNILSVAVGLAIVAVATSVGLRLLDFPALRLSRERFSSPLERLVLAAAAGLGVLALVVFLFGSVGLLSAWFWWPFLAAAAVCGRRPLRDLAADFAAARRDGSWRLHPVALAALAFVVLWCVAHVPLLWAPPLEYDVLEYHLGAAAQYLRDGRISFLHENIYAAMPENGEVLYLLSMVLSGGKWLGLPAAHTVLLCAWFLSIGGVYALVGRILHGAAGTDADAGKAPDRAPAQVGAALAALLYALIPLGSQLVADFYVEQFQALYHLAALAAACAFWNERRAGVRERFGWLVLAGLLAGLGCGAKYPALIFTLLPLLVLVPLFCVLCGSVYEALRAAACVGVPALLALAPWLVRNFAASGDPIYPLGLVLRRRLHGAGAVPDRLDHFDVSLRAGGRSLADLGRSLAQLWPGLQNRESDADLPKAFFWLRDSECGPHLLCFALPGFLSCGRDPQSRGRGEALLVAAVFLFDVALWFLVTHRLNRFMYPLLSPLAVLAGLGIARLWDVARAPAGFPVALREAVVALTVAVVLLIAPLPLLYVWLFSRPAYMAGVEEPQAAAREQFRVLGNPSWFEAWQGINALPPGSKVLCLGDAQTFYLDSTPVYSVVFNEPLLEECLNASPDAATAARLLQAHGITHIYINYSEWFRLDTSYALTRDEPAAGHRSPWRFARLEPDRRSLLRELLYNDRCAAYGRGWPRGVFPALLKLTPAGYARLEQLLDGFTSVEEVWASSSGAPSCELRRLEAPLH